jgi:hypothetical protein
MFWIILTFPTLHKKISNIFLINAFSFLNSGDCCKKYLYFNRFEIESRIITVNRIVSEWVKRSCNKFRRHYRICIICGINECFGSSNPVIPVSTICKKLIPKPYFQMHCAPAFHLRSLLYRLFSYTKWTWTLHHISLCNHYFFPLQNSRQERDKITYRGIFVK